MRTPSWLHSVRDLDAAAAFHDVKGFVGFHDAVQPSEFARLKEAVAQAEKAGRLTVGEEELQSTNDVIYAAPEIEALCKHPVVVRIVRRLTGHPVELQHAKYNAKPRGDLGRGEVKWHQDYPFYPHTNFDLVSCIVHLDDEETASGPVRFIDGSHQWGPISHLKEGKFAYEATGRHDLERAPSTLVACNAGTLTFHHCLTVHRSDPKRVSGDRRLIVFQYRAIDAIQLAGVIWKCAGYQVEDAVPAPRVARFADGRVVELRGFGGRLFDVAGSLRPDKPPSGSAYGE